MKANIKLEHHLLAVEDEHDVHALLELVSPPAPAREREPLRLALVIDRSGSMTGPKLETTKEAAICLVRRLSPADHLALVAYDDEVNLLAPLAPVDRAVLEATIRGIFPGGSTNLSGGWLKGVEELKRGDGDGVLRVLLLTDGLANVGITEPAQLVEMTRGAAEAGIGTTTIGFGADFDEALLTKMADAGRGTGHFAATPDDAPRIFAQEFEDLVSVVAQNVSVEVRPSEEVQVLGILNEYPMVEVPGGIQVQLGDAYGDEVRRVVFAFHVPRLAGLGVATVAEVVLRYASVGDQVALHETTVPVRVNLVTADEAGADEPDAEVTEEVVILKASRAQEDARRLADEGKFDEARQAVAKAADELRARAPGSSKADELLALAEEFEESGEMLVPGSYDAITAKQMTYRTHQTRRRRPKR